MAGVLHVALDGAADVAAATDLRQRLLDLVQPEAIGAGRSVVLDLESLSRCDGAGLQLLLAAQEWIARLGGSLTVRAGGAVAEALQASGAALRVEPAANDEKGSQ